MVNKKINISSVKLLVGLVFLIGIFILLNQKVNIKTYYSTTEKLSFKYPSNWKTVTSQFSLPGESLKADSFTLTSPSRKITISWTGAISGLGGGCSSDVPIGPNNNGCGLLEVVEKDKLPNANLYFVEWIYTTDGINFTPRFALQDNNGYIKSTRTYLYTNVFTFEGKNNYLNLDNGEKTGPFEAVMSGGGIFQRQEDAYFPTTSKENALKFFTDPEMLVAKQILLSASY